MSQLPEILKTWKTQHQCSAWQPQTQHQRSDIFSSKFCGTPYLDPAESWPKCGACDADLQFIVQLNLSVLSSAISHHWGTGLLQLFYCIDPDCNAEVWAPFSEAHLVRIIDPKTNTNPPEIPDHCEDWPEQTVVGWEEFSDVPDPQEVNDLGLEFEYDFAARSVTVIDTHSGIQYPNLDLDSVEEITTAAPGDKLGGWPLWIQGVEYPNCPECKAIMQLILQIDSEDHVPYSWGDVGCGHITQCPQHQNIVAFGWACG